MSGRQSHKELTVKYSLELIQEYMDRREVESTIPFLSVALKCATSRKEYLYLKELLLQGISICTEHVSNDKSCHRDALSAYTLSRLIDMHSTASIRATIRYTFHTKYCWVRNSLSRIFKKNSVVPMIAAEPSYDLANSSSVSMAHSSQRPASSAHPLPTIYSSPALI